MKDKTEKSEWSRYSENYKRRWYRKRVEIKYNTANGGGKVMAIKSEICLDINRSMVILPKTNLE